MKPRVLFKPVVLLLLGAAVFLLRAENDGPVTDSKTEVAEKKLPEYRVVALPALPADRTNSVEMEKARQAFENSLNAAPAGYRFAGMNDAWVVFERKPDLGRRRVVLPANGESLAQVPSR